MSKVKKSRILSKSPVSYIPHDTNFDLSILDTNQVNNNSESVNNINIVGGLSKVLRPVKPVRPVKLTKQATNKTNVYDLSTLANVEKDIEIKKTETNKIDRDQLLKGYDEVPRVEWDSLTHGDHIRYLRNDGLFRKGGFIKNTWIGLSGVNKGKNIIQLCNNMSYKAIKWTIPFDNLNKIWKKKNNVHSMPSDNKDVINSNKESIEYIKSKLDQFSVDISKINNEQQRIVNLIKKLHNIRSRSSSRENQ
jgi:hypothetical protein